MIVYHGSGQVVTTPELRKSRFNKDFGTGFYCTNIKEQAARWTAKFPKKTINFYRCEINNKLDILEFKTMTDEWLDFIVDCRNGKPHTHDIVIGSMANDQIYNFVTSYVSGLISREAFWALAKFNYPTHQIVFCTEAALQCLTFAQSEEIN